MARTGTLARAAPEAAITVGCSQARYLMASVSSFRTVSRRFVWSIRRVALATRVSWLRLLPMRPNWAMALALIRPESR
jgi:hypothetical protein